jgi:hypothetical protein
MAKSDVPVAPSASRTPFWARRSERALETADIGFSRLNEIATTYKDIFMSWQSARQLKYGSMNQVSEDRRVPGLNR